MAFNVVIWNALPEETSDHISTVTDEFLSTSKKPGFSDSHILTSLSELLSLYNHLFIVFNLEVALQLRL